MTQQVKPPDCAPCAFVRPDPRVDGAEHLREVVPPHNLGVHWRRCGRVRGVECLELGAFVLLAQRDVRVVLLDPRAQLPLGRRQGSVISNALKKRAEPLEQPMKKKREPPRESRAKKRNRASPRGPRFRGPPQEKKMTYLKDSAATVSHIIMTIYIRCLARCKRQERKYLKPFFP